MSKALAIDTPPVFLFAHQKRRRSFVHTATLAAVWITVATSFLVFSEPALFDALTFGLFVLLPFVGLFEARRGLAGGGALLMVLASCITVGVLMSRDTNMSLQHSVVTFYLFGACFLFAGFIARNPQVHTRLILNAYFTATIFAAALGVAGYLNLFPGAYDLLTRYGRATSTFKDPNVYGPFLIPGLLMALHLWLVRPLRRGLLPLGAAALITLGILFSFSRGAWAATAIAVAIYCWIYLYSAQRNSERMKLAGFVIAGTIALGLMIAVAFQSEGVADLLAERASLAQTYDVGPEGRFGGQEKAIQLILENPLGIGAQAFTRFHHHEEAHNVYLSMFMNAGWLGGSLFFIICASTLWLGFLHALKPTKTQLLFSIAFAALAGNIVEGVLIDSDHWRHVFLLMGIVWGLMASDTKTQRSARIVRDVRPILANSVLIVPPTRRSRRIVGKVAPRLPLPANLNTYIGPHPGRRRAARIVENAALTSS